MDKTIEIISVILGLAYLYFLIKEQIVCWIFGILSSLLSILLFYRTGLYSESILYIYYVLIGVYGFYYWNKKTGNNQTFEITELPLKSYVLFIVLGEVLALSLAYTFDNYTDANAPYLDAHTTVFSFIASFLEIKKYLASWKFWIIINGLTVFLYLDRGLNYYTGLTVIYLIFSFVGYIKWKAKLKPSTIYT
jgi:nicotinamide mononucleotide transporter